MTEPLALVNGRRTRASQLAISPVDAGFVLGVTVAEQLRTFGGKIFRLDSHLARLEHSLDVVGFDPGMTRRQLAEAATELVAHNHELLAPGDDLGLSVFVTPGIYPAYAEAAPAGPTVVLHTYPLPFRLWADKYEAGQPLVTTPYRQVPADCWPAELKCRSRMHYYLADRYAAAVEPGARALLLDHEGRVAEASTANVLIIRAGEGLISPPAARILPGISLAVVGELAEGLGLALLERDLVPADLAAADEVLLSSTPFCMLPVTRFNGRAIGEGRPGPVFRKLLEAWTERMGVDPAGQARQFARR
jgi:branched-chain amino acid aminotransferase